jgi:hypothetical protein
MIFGHAQYPEDEVRAFMTIYIFSILLLFTLSCLELNVAISPATKKALTLFVYVFLVLQVGLRWETGTDWNAYLQHFEFIDTFSSASPTLTSPEYGYNIVVWLFKMVTSSYSIFLVIHAAVYYYLIFNSIKRYTDILFLPLMVFYCVTMGVTGSNRELIAAAIGLYSLRYICDGKRIYFFLFVALACMFHLSALILLLFPLFNRKIRPAMLWILLACSIAIGASRLPQLIFFSGGNLLGGLALLKANYYLRGSQDSLADSGLSAFGLVKRLVLLILFYCNRRSLSEKLRYYNVMLNAYIAGVVIYFIFANSLLILVSRGDLYFNVLEPLLLASQVYLLTRRSNRLVMASALCVLSFFFFSQSISIYPDLFMPYKGLYINNDYSRIMH